MKIKFRPLRADEIEVRVATINDKGCSLLLYKDARCDMALLDETVGQLNWKREHCRDNANCIVSIFDTDKNQWVSKEDTGKESYTEKEKGLASDSFKRACVNWGIGRELYTAPFIWVTDVQTYDNKGKKATSDKFRVDKIEYDNGVITDLIINNTGRYGDKNNIVFHMGGNVTPAVEQMSAVQKLDPAAVNTLVEKLRQRNKICGANGTEKDFAGLYKKSKFSELTYTQFKNCMARLDISIKKVNGANDEANRKN